MKQKAFVYLADCLAQLVHGAVETDPATLNALVREQHLFVALNLEAGRHREKDEQHVDPGVGGIP